MRVAASQAVTDNFLVKNAAGELVDADSTPTAVLYRKGAATAVSVTVASVTGTGKYSFAFTNGAYDSGDPIWIEVTATVSGTAYTAKVWQATVDAKIPLPAEIAGAVADETITGAEHNVQNSIAKFLREAAQGVAFRNATAQGGTDNTITLDANASSTDGAYVDAKIVLIENTGRGGHRIVTAYNGTTKVATMDGDWQAGNPDSTTEFAISSAVAVLGEVVHTGATVPVVTTVNNANITQVAGETAEATETIDFDTINDSGTVVLPASATVPSRGSTDTISLYEGETITQSITITDADGDAVDMSGKTIAVEVEDLSGTDVATIEDGDITRSGASNQTLTFAWPSAVTATVRSLVYAIRDASAPRSVYAAGRIEVRDTTVVD